ncbi:MAG: MFS transporter, partial [Elusimicrobia bacterium]|nr:MFS transporter [Elusimicrobiota bacterium]
MTNEDGQGLWPQLRPRSSSRPAGTPNVPELREGAAERDLTPSPLNPYRGHQIKILAATWTAYAGLYFCRKTFYVVKADLAGALNIGVVSLAHLGTAYLAAYMVGQFTSAYLGRITGAKRLLLLGMGLSIVCNIVFGLSNYYWPVMIFMILNGLTQGMGWPSCIGSLAFWFQRRQRGSILGVWSTCYQIGGVVSVLLASYLLGLAGWRWAFFGGVSVLTVVWFFVLWAHPGRPQDVGLSPITDEPDPQAGESEKIGAGHGLGWDRKVVLTIINMGVI